VLDEAKVKHWIGKGALPSGSAARLLAARGLYDKSKVPIRKARVSKKESK
jgi:ribosomal protein S16